MHESDTVQKRWRLVLFSLVILGGVLRFYRLGSQALFLDEAISLDIAQRSLAEIWRYARQDVHPILYYILLKGALSLVPATEWGIRASSALFSTSALCVLAWWLTRRAGAKAATGTVAILAVASFDIYYAQEARMYSLLAFLWLLSFVLLVEALAGHPYLWAAWGTVSVLVIHTHFYGFLLLAASGVGALGYLMQHREVRKHQFRWMIVGWGIAILSGLPLVYRLWSGLGSGAGGAWVPRWRDLLTMLRLWSSGLSPARQQFLRGSLLAWTTGPWIPDWILETAGLASGTGLAIVGMWACMKGRDKAEPMALQALSFLLVPVVLAFVYGLSRASRTWAFKSLLGAALLYWMFAGIGWAWLRSWVSNLALAVLILVNVLSLSSYHGSWTKSDSRMAFQELEKVFSEKDAVLLHRAYASPLMNFYFRAPDATRFGIVPQGRGSYAWVQILPAETLAGETVPIECEHARGWARYFVYGPPTAILSERELWDCDLDGQHMWIFDVAARVWRPADH